MFNKYHVVMTRPFRFRLWYFIHWHKWLGKIVSFDIIAASEEELLAVYSGETFAGSCVLSIEKI